MIHRLRWYLIASFIGLSAFIQHDRTNYHRPHKELLGNFNLITPSIAQTKNNIFETEKNPILYNRKDIQCLARNIFFEAGTESMLGKIAVGQVTVNRVKIGHWGETVCDVVHAKDQFSWTNKDDLSIDKDSRTYRDSVVAAKRVLSERKRLRILRHALFYHADYVRPNWIDRNQKIGQIGTHVFYNGAKGSSLSL
jgi:spore germination cell wall hydrolase CwlJ-like protein